MGFQQALSGLNAAAKNLDTIGNNVSNSNTIGFKGAQTRFADAFANSLGGSGGASAGIGVNISGINQLFSQGNITATSNPLDIAISGGGFFRLSTGGAITYGRNGQFKVDKDGFIVNDAGSRLTGYLPDTSGTLVTTAPVDLEITTSDIAPQRTTDINVVANLNSTQGTHAAASFNLNDPSTYNSSTSLSVYDSLGNSHSLSLYFLKTAANSWEVFASNDGVQVGAGAIGTVNFTSAGAINTATTTMPFTVSAPVTTGATSPLTFSVDLTGTTQFGSNFGVSTLTQDGFSSGRLSGYEISDDGVLLGRYSNGQSNTLGQIALASFNNAQGLQPLGNNVWAETSNSGPALVGTPNSGNLGTLQSGAVEESNVDLTAELVNMITAQRIYQANAQTIKTQDAVLQTLVNLR